MNDLIQIFKDKIQPKDWSPHKYTTLYRNLKLWGNFFGLPILRRDDGEVTIAQTIANMNRVRSKLAYPCQSYKTCLLIYLQYGSPRSRMPWKIPGGSLI